MPFAVVIAGVAIAVTVTLIVLWLVQKPSTPASGGDISWLRRTPTGGAVVGTALGLLLVLGGVYWLFPEFFAQFATSHVFWPVVVGVLVIAALRAQPQRGWKILSSWLVALLVLASCGELANRYTAYRASLPAPPPPPPPPRISTLTVLDTVTAPSDGSWSAWRSVGGAMWAEEVVPDVDHVLQDQQGREHHLVGRQHNTLPSGIVRLRIRSLDGQALRVFIAHGPVRDFKSVKAPPAPFWSESVQISQEVVDWHVWFGTPAETIRVLDSFGDEHQGDVNFNVPHLPQWIQFQAVGGDTVLVLVAYH